MVSMHNKSIGRKGSAAGFTMIEALIVVAVGLLLASFAIPTARSAIATYQLDAAVDTAAGAIQSQRYQAIMHGYSYQVDFNSTTNQIQVSSEAPPATTFTATASALPVSSSAVTLGVGTPNMTSAGHLTLQLKANGSLSTTSGQAMPAVLTIAYHGTTKTLTVSNYGSVIVR